MININFWPFLIEKKYLIKNGNDHISKAKYKYLVEVKPKIGQLTGKIQNTKRIECEERNLNIQIIN